MNGSTRAGGALRFGVALLVLLASVLGAMPTRAEAATPTLHLTAAGDYDDTSNTTTVLDGIRARNPQTNLMLGDFFYAPPPESTWCDYVKSHVDAIPQLLLSGNHESTNTDSINNGYIDNFVRCLPNATPGVVGTYGKEFYVDIPAENPVARIVMISPGITYGSTTATKWTYTKGDAHYNWTAAAIDGARTKGVPWVIVGMHKPCLSTGRYSCEAGPDITDLMLSKKVDLVLHGHEHLYQRSKQLRNGVAGCSTLTVGSYNSACVADSDSTLTKGVGTVFATVGTAGTPLRDVNLSDSEAGYFSRISGLNRYPTYGFLDLRLTGAKLTATFVNTQGGYQDAFTIARERYAADEFSRTLSNGWGTPNVGSAWRLTGDPAKAKVSNGAGLLVTDKGKHLSLSQDFVHRYTDTRMRVALDKLPTGSGYYLRIDARVKGKAYYTAKYKVDSSGGVYVALARVDDAGKETSLKGYTQVPDLSYRAGDVLNVRFQVSSRFPAALKAKVWRAGAAEPGWLITASDSLSVLQYAGGWRLDGYLSSAATNGPVTAKLDDLVVDSA